MSEKPSFDPDEIRRRFVDVRPYPTPQQWEVGGIGGRRSGEIGLGIANVGLRHAAGFEVVLLFPDGKIDSFSHMNLFPASSEQQS